MTMTMTAICSLIISSVNESLFSYYGFLKAFVAEESASRGILAKRKHDLDNKNQTKVNRFLFYDNYSRTL